MGIVGGNLLGDPVIRSDQLTDRASGITNHHKKGACARLAQVERGLEQTEGQVGWRGAPHRLTPARKLAGNVEQAPPRIAQAECHRPPGEDLDLRLGVSIRQTWPPWRVALAWL